MILCIILIAFFFCSDFVQLKLHSACCCRSLLWDLGCIALKMFYVFFRYFVALYLYMCNDNKVVLVEEWKSIMVDYVSNTWRQLAKNKIFHAHVKSELSWKLFSFCQCRVTVVTNLVWIPRKPYDIIQHESLSAIWEIIRSSDPNSLNHKSVSALEVSKDAWL